VSNQAAQAKTASCIFRVDGRVPELWQPETGRRETAALFSSQDGRTVLPIALEPHGSVFVVFRQPAAKGKSVVSIRSAAGEITAASGWHDSLVAPPTAADGKTVFAVRKAGRYEVVMADGRSRQVDVAALPAAVEVTGPWVVQFPPKLGAPASATLPRLMSWTESADDGIKHFSGTATYLKTIRITSEQLGPQSRLFLDLGAVKNVCEVRMNGQDLGVLWKAPFRLDVSAAARVGDNELELRITNLWPNRLIGDQKVPAAQRIAWTTYNPYTPSSPLFPSGLLGPVKLESARTVTLAP
jgi:hypothetical protein